MMKGVSQTISVLALSCDMLNEGTLVRCSCKSVKIERTAGRGPCPEVPGLAPLAGLSAVAFAAISRALLTLLMS